MRKHFSAVGLCKSGRRRSLSPFLRRRGALFSVSYNGQEQMVRNIQLPLHVRDISCDNTSTPKTKCALVVRSPHARATATAIVRNLTKSVEIKFVLPSDTSCKQFYR